MSLIFRRGLSTLIPPKIASPSGIGAAQDAKRMQRLTSFYAKLPRGPAPEPRVSGPLSWYRKRYFSEGSESAAPIAHLIVFFMLLGYSSDYYFHLRHHKNNAH